MTLSAIASATRRIATAISFSALASTDIADHFPGMAAGRLHYDVVTQTVPGTGSASLPAQDLADQ